MREHLHTREYLDAGDIAVLDCDTQCNFMLMTDSNYSNYKVGRNFEYHGGHFKSFPGRVQVGASTHWNVVIDLGGGSGRIRHSLSFIKG